MNKKVFFSLLLSIATTFIFGQTVVYSTNFGSANVTSASLQTGWVASGANVANLQLSTSSNSGSNYSTPIASSAGANLNDNGGTGVSVATISGVVNTTGYSNIQVIWGARASSASYTGVVAFQFSVDNGANWTSASYTDVTRNGNWAVVNGGNWISIPNAGDVSDLRFRFTYTRTTSGGNYRIDDFTVRGVPSFPAVSASGTPGGFLTSVGTPSTSQTVIASGVNLTAPLVVTAPTGFEVSSDGTNFSSSVSLTPASGIVLATNISVRLTGVSAGQFVAGNVILSSTGATSQTVNVQGITYATPSTFGADNIVVLQAGSGALQANGTGVPILIREFNTVGGYVQTVPIPFVNSGSNYGVTMSNSGTSEGALNLSGDQQRLTLVGYNAPVGTSNVSSSASATYPRVAIAVYNDGSVNTSTIVNDAFTGNNVRSSVTQDGSGFWMAGAAGGVRYVTLGSTGASTSISNNDASVRVVSIVDGQLWCSSNTATLIGLSKVGTGLPITSVANTLQIASTDSYAYQFLDANSSIPGADLLYIANNTTLIKMSYDGATWSAKGTLTGTNITGVCAKWDAVTSTATIYATNGTGLWKIIDNTGATSNIVSSGSALTAVATSIATPITNTAFRGVAFAPSVAATCTFYPDVDGDGYGASTGAQQFTCNSSQTGFVEQINTDCNDANGAINPGATELACNTIDDNCNSSIDENFVAGCNDPSACNYSASATCATACDYTQQTYYQDNDGDGFGSSVSQLSCVVPTGYVLTGGDCNDNNNAVKPSASENLCNGIDDNCNGSVDEGGVSGCTDANASNYNAAATCNTGCIYNDFTAGNIIALRVGSGAAVLTSGATAMFLDEIGSTGLVQTIAVPTTGSNRMVMSGSSTSEGQITRSQDFSKIAIAGYDAAPGLASVNTAANVSRAIGTIGLNSGTFARVATSSNFFLGNNFRSACANGTDYWGGGTATSTGGVNYFGAGAATNVSNSPITNVRVVSVQNDQLYFSTGSSPTGIYSVGTGTPTTSGVTAVNVISTGTSASPYAFQFSLDGNTCYIADDRTNASGGVQKWVKNAGSWSLAYTISMGASTGARGVVVDFYAGAQPKVYAVAVTSSTTRVVAFVDNGTSNPTLTTLVTQATNTAIRSIAFAPCTPSTWYADVDGDGYGVSSSTLSYCTQPYGYVANSTDCNDAAAANYPGNSEICDGLDNDCNGAADNGLTFVNYYNDADGDTYGAGTATNACQSPGATYVTNNTDCDDAASSTNPGASEICDGLDNDCNGTADNGLTFVNYYNDADGDAYGAGTATNACQSPGATYVTNNTDCNDAASSAFPGGSEVCGNSIDEDCSGADLSCPQGSFSTAIVVANIGQFGTGSQTTQSVNLSTGTNTVQSPGLGLDKWFSFTASSNAMRIAVVGSSAVADDNDLSLYETPTDATVQLIPMVSENDVHPGSTGAAADGGSETLIFDQLIVGDVYYLCVRNNNNTAGSVSLTLSNLNASTTDIALYTNGTNTFTSACQNFKVKFRPNSAGYTINRWNSADISGNPSWSYAIPVTSTVASTICQLGKVAPANLSGSNQTVYVTVDVLYNLTDAFGTVTPATARANAAASFQMASEADLNVRTTDRCTAGFKSTTSSIATNRSVCGTTRYVWEMSMVYPLSALPLEVQGPVGGSRILMLNSVPALANGQRYDVRIASKHLDGATQTAYGTTQCVKTLGAAGMPTIEEEINVYERSENGITTIIYPNPNNGQTVNFSINGLEGALQLNVTDATGRQVYNNRFMVEGAMNTTLDFGQTLADGVYMVEMVQNGEMKTMRMVVSK
jgi:hypothetical protein